MIIFAVEERAREGKGAEEPWKPAHMCIAVCVWTPLVYSPLTVFSSWTDFLFTESLMIGW
jgi:hypothetical protein